jgi:hypothetical protein
MTVCSQAQIDVHLNQSVVQGVEYLYEVPNERHLIALCWVKDYVNILETEEKSGTHLLTLQTKRISNVSIDSLRIWRFHGLATVEK